MNGMFEFLDSRIQSSLRDSDRGAAGYPGLKPRANISRALRALFGRRAKGGEARPGCVGGGGGSRRGFAVEGGRAAPKAGGGATNARNMESGARSKALNARGTMVRVAAVLFACLFLAAGCGRTPEERLERAIDKYVKEWTPEEWEKQLPVIEEIAYGDYDISLRATAFDLLMGLSPEDRVMGYYERILQVSATLDGESRSNLLRDTGSKLFDLAIEYQNTEFLDEAIALAESEGVDLHIDPGYRYGLISDEHDEARQKHVLFFSQAMRRLVRSDIDRMPTWYWDAYYFCAYSGAVDCDEVVAEFQEQFADQLAMPGWFAYLASAFYQYLRALDEARPASHPAFGDVTPSNFDDYVRFEMERWFGEEWRAAVLDEDGYPFRTIYIPWFDFRFDEMMKFSPEGWDYPFHSETNDHMTLEEETIMMMMMGEETFKDMETGEAQ